MGKTTIKCVACGEDIIMSEDDRVLVISPRNEWEGYFHFPKCMVAISKAAAKQSVQADLLSCPQCEGDLHNGYCQKCKAVFEPTSQ